MTSSDLSPFRGPAGEFATLLPPAGDAYLRVQRTAGGSEGLVIMGSPGGFTFCTGRLYCLTGRNPETGRLADPAA